MKNIIRIIAIVVLFLIFTFAVCSAMGSSMRKYEWVEKTYTVKKGDTLWKISDKYCPADVDKSDWIYEVERINNMDGAMIFVGQKIILLEVKK